MLALRAVRNGNHRWLVQYTPRCRRKKLRPLRPRLTARTPLCCVPSSSPHENRFAGFSRGPLIFFQKKKRKRAVHGPKEKKKDTGGSDGGLRLNERRSRNDFPRAMKLSGGLSDDEWTDFPFRCRFPGNRRTMEGLPFFRR